jgi:hypothetical protein
MISEATRQSINDIFIRAARTNLAMNDGDSVEVGRVADDPFSVAAERNIVVLTISSYLFRLLTVFHVDSAGATAAYFARGECSRPFDEIFGEVGNLCCGAMNRELGGHFAHLGMSTPYMLEAKCAGFLRELRPGYAARHRIDINGAVTLHATLCLCAYAPLDFRAQPPAAETLGCIELF